MTAIFPYRIKLPPRTRKLMGVARYKILPGAK
jgi:hypothetical protein